MKRFTRLQTLLCLTLLAALAALAAQAQESPPADAPPPAPPPRCASDLHRQFDFWLGTWEVRGKDRPDGPHGRNVIALDHDGCVLREHYTAGRYSGSSLNFVALTGRWHQTWIDNQGFSIEIDGGLDERGNMVLESDPAKTPIQRITWTPNADGTVRQHWQQSKDGGASWSDVFDGLYVKIDG